MLFISRREQMLLDDHDVPGRTESGQQIQGRVGVEAAE
jgi:hypothetical protein